LHFKNKPLPLHPQLDQTSGLKCKKDGSRKYFEKTFQNIWWFQNNDLSLHRFSALKIAGIKNEVLMQIRI
jgi:hypothetical protein